MTEPLFSLSDTHATETKTFELAADSLGIDLGPAWPDRFGESLLHWSADLDGEPINTLSLFSGAGGLDIGFHDAGFRIIDMVEIEERFVRSLDANSGVPDAPLSLARGVCTDIADYSAEHLPRIDFIVGGPPCQTFSAAGRRSHGVMGTDDPRGELFVEYLRLVEETQPKGFLFENVYGIIGAQNGEPWRRIVESFEGAGYHVSYRILDTADYGVPQHRERLFIVGVKEGSFKFPRPTHGPDSPGQLPHFGAEEAIADLAGQPHNGPDSLNGKYGHLLADIPPGLNYSFFTEKMGHPTPIFAWRSKFSDFLYKADPEMPVRTVKAQGGQYTGPFHWENRPFTVAELKRLQTFPDEYEIVGNRLAAIHQIGNSVPPQAARVLALAVLDNVFGVELPFELQYLEPHEELTFRKLKRRRTVMYQEKAKAAISQLEAPATTADESLVAEVDGRYQLEQGVELSKADEGSIQVRTSVADSVLKFDVRGEAAVDSTFTIRIQPNPTYGWQLTSDEVVLEGDATVECFTAAWKSFDRTLHRLGIKADLVQLNGYYQYESRISAKLDLIGQCDDTIWRILRSVVAGNDVGVTRNADSLAFSWGVPTADVLEYCRMLRTAGYEVRNSQTNPQIPEGDYLIPYAFPTLTKASVQLRKSL